MSGVNRVIIIGNLGRDPEIKYQQNGAALCKFSVATSESWMDKQSGQKKEETTWHNIVVFGKQAENCEKYLAKGKQVYVEGKLKTSTYEKEGQTHYSTSIVAQTVQFLSGGNSGGGQGGQQGQGGYQPQGSQGQPQGGYQPPQQQQRPPQGQGVQGGYQPPADNTPPESDIPF